MGGGKQQWREKSEQGGVANEGAWPMRGRGESEWGVVKRAWPSTKGRGQSGTGLVQRGRGEEGAWPNEAWPSRGVADLKEGVVKKGRGHKQAAW